MTGTLAGSKPEKAEPTLDESVFGLTIDYGEWILSSNGLASFLRRSPMSAAIDATDTHEMVAASSDDTRIAFCAP
jgi:hypothetical protein